MTKIELLNKWKQIPIFQLCYDHNLPNCIFQDLTKHNPNWEEQQKICERCRFHGSYWWECPIWSLLHSHKFLKDFLLLEYEKATREELKC